MSVVVGSSVVVAALAVAAALHIYGGGDLGTVIGDGVASLIAFFALIALGLVLLVVAILVGLAHFPWPKRPMGVKNVTLGSNNYDWKECEKLIEMAKKESPMPPLSIYEARDGAKLSYRLYRPPEGKMPTVTIIAHHGSTGPTGAGACMHKLATMLAEKGATVYVPDLRGHGSSVVDGQGPGHVGSSNQISEDLVDLFLRRIFNPRNPMQQQRAVFLGHSAQGGAAWYFAQKPELKDKFSAFVAIAPLIGLDDGKVLEPQKSNFAQANVPRLVALTVLNKVLCVTRFNGQSVVRFYTEPTDTVDGYTFQNSYAMMLAHSPMAAHDMRSVIRRVPAATRVLHLTAKREEVFKDQSSEIKRLFPGAVCEGVPGTHMGVLFEQETADVIWEFIEHGYEI